MAGGFTIDGYAAPFVDRIDGDHGAVLGLSLPAPPPAARRDRHRDHRPVGHDVTLRIGPLDVDPPVVLAPMAGVTDAPFRGVCSRFGAGLYVSEMITARALVERNARTLAMLRFDGSEATRSVQLYGTDPRTLGEAVRYLVDDIGVDHVDMNFGCPVPKVTRKGGGSALPVHRALLRDIVRAAVARRRAGPGHHQVPHGRRRRASSPTSTPVASPRRRGWPPSRSTPAPPSSSTAGRPAGTPSPR